MTSLALETLPNPPQDNVTVHVGRGVAKRLRKLKPNSIRSCVLLDKPSRRVKKVTADYVGFEVPDEFVVGYGLDYAERFRNLPFVAVLKPEVYSDQ